MTSGWTDPVITATDLPSFSNRGYSYRRQEVCDLLRRNGVDPRDVAAIRYQVVDAPMLTVRLLERDDEGRRFCGPDGRVATREADVLFRGPLPDWWQPSMP
jgi:hypothetical protein